MGVCLILLVSCIGCLDFGATSAHLLALGNVSLALFRLSAHARHSLSRLCPPRGAFMFAENRR